MTYRAVFFDAGETLVHPYPSFHELFARVLEERGSEVVPARVHAGMNVVSERFAIAAREGELWTTTPERSRKFWLSVYELYLSALGLATDLELPEILYSTFSDPANYRLFTDVPPVLERLSSAGVTLGVISNFEGWLEGLLASLGVAEYLGVRVISGVVGIEKPDPEIFRLALDRAGVAAAESVYVGDNPEFDVAPAVAVGMHPVLIDRRGRYGLSDASCRSGTSGTTLIRSIRELPEAVGL